MISEFKYRAFISYSHSDERWAAWLHRALETYRLPKRLVGEPTPFGPVPQRIAPIFRDRDELPTATNLGEVLTQALADSACQIVICSPAAAKSRWTNEEILTFKRLGRSDRIFALIVDGEPGASNDPVTAQLECFPPALIHEIGDDGELSDRRSEPIAADARAGKDNRNNAKLKLIAGMLGVGFDALRQREQQRRNRRMAVLTAAAVGGMAITSVLAVSAYLARNEAQQQRNRAQIEAETARQTTQFMVDLFKVSDPDESKGNTITAREILDKGVQRIDGELAGQPEIQATLMDTMGTVYTSLGLYPQALRLIDRSVQKRRTLFGDEHPEVAASLEHLGEVQTLSADYDDAEQNLREALATRRQLFGDRSLEVADSATSLADVLQHKGDYEASRALIVEALDIRRALLKPPNSAIAASLEDLGLNDYDHGDLEKAVPSLRAAVEMRRELPGQEPTNLAEAVNNLAFALSETGDLEEAEALFREALKMKRKLLGERHPEIAYGLNNLGRVQEMRGKLDEAEATYREALDMERELLGERHPEVAVALGNLAFVKYAKNDKDDAIDLARQSLDIRREALGADNPATASIETSLGYWLVERGDYKEAETLLTESLATRRKVLGEEHPQTGATMAVMAQLMLATGRFEQALSMARDAQRILLLSLPEGNWRVAVAKNCEGLALAGMGEYRQAEPLLLSSLEGLKQAPIPDLAANGKKKMAEFYRAWGRPEKAAQFGQP